VGLNERVRKFVDELKSIGVTVLGKVEPYRTDFYGVISTFKFEKTEDLIQARDSAENVISFIKQRRDDIDMILIGSHQYWLEYSVWVLVFLKNGTKLAFQIEDFKVG